MPARRSMPGWSPRSGSSTATGAKSAPAVPYDAATPLETTVEREAPPFDLVTHRQVSQALFRLIGGARRCRRGQDRAGRRLSAHRGRRSTAMAPTPARRRRCSLPRAHLVNARTLLAAIGDGSFDGDGQRACRRLGRLEGRGDRGRADARHLVREPLRPAVGAGRRCLGARAARIQFRLHDRGAGPGRDAFSPRAPMTMASSTGGPSISTRRRADLGAETTPRPPEKRDVLSFIPVPVSFAGMPSPRFWEMEDRKTEFADIDSTHHRHRQDPAHRVRAGLRQ